LCSVLLPDALFRDHRFFQALDRNSVGLRRLAIVAFWMVTIDWAVVVRGLPLSGHSPCVFSSPTDYAFGLHRVRAALVSRRNAILLYIYALPIGGCNPIIRTVLTVRQAALGTLLKRRTGGNRYLLE
jgi:hypothetical protein